MILETAKEFFSESPFFFLPMSSRLFPASYLSGSVYLVFIEMFYTFGVEFSES